MSAYYEQGSKADTWAIVAGVILIVVGMLAIGAPLATAAVTSAILPIALFVKGVAELSSMGRARSTGSSVWRLIVGIVSILAGFLLLFRPALALVSLTVILIAYLLVDGIVRLAAALSSNVDGRWWVALAGAVSLALGILLWVQPFSTTLIIIGIYIGIDVLFAGVALVAAGLASRRAYSGGMTSV